MSTIDVNRIPAEIRALDRWVTWKREMRDGKPTKVPYVAGNPDRKAKSNDAATWRSFEAALADYEVGKCDGIGFMLGDGWVGVDLDDCIDDAGEIEQEEIDPSTGELKPGAAEFIRRLDSYSEISPSGAGIKGLVRGDLPKGRRKRGCTWGSERKGAIEMYARTRFFTITGNHLPGTPTTIEDRTEALAALHAAVFPAKQSGNGQRPEPLPLDLSDHELIDKALAAKNGSKFSALWNGDASGYASHSDADLALCNLLAFWTDRDAGRMDRLFRGSGLIREKWDEMRGEQTYGQLTIDRAIEGCRETYTPRRAQTSTSSVRPNGHQPASGTFNGREPVVADGEAGKRDYTHDGLALELGDRWQDARYVSAWGQWLFYTGAYWRTDESLLHMTRCRAFLRTKAERLEALADQVEEGAAEVDQDELMTGKDVLDPEKLRKLAKSLRDAKTVAQVVNLARSNLGQAAVVEQWDTNPLRIGTQTQGGTE